LTDSVAIPVLVGLAVGIVLIILVSIMLPRPEGTLEPARVWVAVNATQCNDMSYESLLAGKGIAVYDTDLNRWLRADMAVCEACFVCPSGWTYYFEIEKSDEPLARELGFVSQSPN
jgi:hypothetical protein